MNKPLAFTISALTIGASLFIGGCSGHAPTGHTSTGHTSTGHTSTGYGTAEETTVAQAADPVMEQAAADLKAAKAAKSEWRVIDKAGGGSAQNLSKLMEIAENKAAEGELEEAHRIAALISKYATLGIAQGEKQKNAKPSYAN